MFLPSIAMAAALVLETVHATPFADGVGTNHVIKRQNVNCNSKNAILQALRDPSVSADASKFCQTFISAIQTVIATTFTAITPGTVTITEYVPVPTRTNTTVTTFPTTTSAIAIQRRWDLEKRQRNSALPSYVSKFKQDRISNACSCIVTTSGTTTRVTTLTASNFDYVTTTTTGTPTCPVPTPIVKNGGFEEGEGPWDTDDNRPRPYRLTTESFSGVFSNSNGCNIVREEPLESGLLKQRVNLCPGTEYRLTFAYKFLSGRDLNAVFDVKVGSEQVALINYRGSDAIDQWRTTQAIFATATTGGGTVDLSFLMRCGPFLGLLAPQSASIFIDDVAITPLT